MKLLKSLGLMNFFSLRNKMYAFKCEDDSRNKVKGHCKSQSVNKKLEEYEKCLDGSYQKYYAKYNIRLNNREMYLQRVQKSTLSPFDDKRFYINIIESKLRI